MIEYSPSAIWSLAFCRIFIMLSASATAAVRRSVVPLASLLSSLSSAGMSVSCCEDIVAAELGIVHFLEWKCMSESRLD